MHALQGFEGTVVIGRPSVQGLLDIPFLESEQAIIRGRVGSDIPSVLA
jgi:hypothetical protein